MPGPVVIHIGRATHPHAVAGQIWLDAALLDSGRFSWGVVQHEYAHQVDFAVLTDAMRAELHGQLQGTSLVGLDLEPLAARLRAVRRLARLGLLAVAGQRDEAGRFRRRGQQGCPRGLPRDARFPSPREQREDDLGTEGEGASPKRVMRNTRTC